MNPGYKRAITYIYARKNNTSISHLMNVEIVKLVAHLWNKTYREVAEDVVNLDKN